MLSKVIKLAKGRNINPDKFSILISHRVSANMRSTSFKVIYEALCPLIDDCNIYVHDSNLSKDDINYINAGFDNRIKVIHANDTEEYLKDLYEVSLTISVDSAAIHFREGVQKPAIGIYSSFTSECRTKYYRFTKSIDIKSNCKFQPCFLHQTAIGQVCNISEPNSDIAPCLDPKYNLRIIEQLTADISSAMESLNINVITIQR